MITVNRRLEHIVVLFTSQSDESAHVSIDTLGHEEKRRRKPDHKCEDRVGLSASATGFQLLLVSSLAAFRVDGSEIGEGKSRVEIVESSEQKLDSLFEREFINAILQFTRKIKNPKSIMLGFIWSSARQLR
jgi:hypothetical protein